MPDVSVSAEKALRMVREAPTLVYDTETSGLDWKRNYPVGYVIGCKDEVVYVPVRHGGGGNLPDSNVRASDSPVGDWPLPQHRFEQELNKAFQDRQRLVPGYVVGHHLKFDLHMSATGGVDIGRNLCDTQVAASLIDEHAKGYSLDACALRHGVTPKLGGKLYQHLADLFGVPATKSAMSEFWRLPGDDPVGVEYATGDGVTTLELYHEQQSVIAAQELDRIWELERRLTYTLFRMERHGVRINQDALAQLIQDIERRTAEALGALPEGFNVRSPAQVKEYMESAGHDDWPTTDKGNPSFTENWLKQSPEGKLVIGVRQWTNLLNTFVKPLAEQHLFHGRVHCSFNQSKTDEFGVVSGRLSCSDPNLQAVPKRNKKLAILFRTLFEPDPGLVFFEGDYSQAEPRLFGHFSREPAIVDGYSANPPRDMHAVAAELLKVERDPTAKRMNMGMLTGMYPKALAGHMGWTVAKAQEEWDRYFSLFPGIRGFQEQTKRVIESRGYVRTLLGRRCRLGPKEFSYKATSKVIQGNQADILKERLLRFDQWCETQTAISPLLTVHDSYEWQAPEGTDPKKEILPLLEDVTGAPFNLRVPFVVDMGSGRNWAEASFGAEAVSKVLAEEDVS